MHKGVTRNNVFEFDIEEDLPAGLTNRRKGNRVYLGQQLQLF
jgi:hypothetical protein